MIGRGRAQRQTIAPRVGASVIVVSRDRIQTMLENHPPVADQPVGRPDVTGRGHQAHLAFWERIVEAGRIVGIRGQRRWASWAFGPTRRAVRSPSC